MTPTLTTGQMAAQVHAVTLPDGKIQFRNALDLAVFRHLCNVQARRFNEAPPPQILATLHVDGAAVHVDWHQQAPLEGEVEVYDAPTRDELDGLPILVDREGDVLQIGGIKYAGDLLRGLGIGGLAHGQVLQIVGRDDGVLTFREATT